MSKKIEQYNGIIPNIYKRIKCSLWLGHKYKVISPEFQGQNLVECEYCGKRKSVYLIPKI